MVSVKKIVMVTLVAVTMLVVAGCWLLLLKMDKYSVTTVY